MLKIKKIIISILILMFVCVNICGCNTNNANDTITEKATSNTTSSTQNETKATNADTEIILQFTKKFSEDLAWVYFRKGADTQNYCGCIDKSGNLLFYTEDNNLNHFLNNRNYIYSNGYTFIENSDYLYLIDKKGTIVSKYSNNSEKNAGKVIAYADGYVWYQEYISNFDEAYYKYTLYDPNGNPVTDFQQKGTEPTDIMYYYGNNVWGYGTNYYFIESDKWLDIEISSNGFYFYDNIALVGTTPEKDNSDIDCLVFMDTKGNVTYAQLPNYSHYSQLRCYGISENCCILYNFIDEYLISYNITSNEFVKMDNKYTDKINYEFLFDSSKVFIFENGKVGLPLYGTDKEYYVGLFDTSWNIIGEPIDGMHCDLSEGKFIIDNIHVYDDKLKLLFSVSDLGYQSVSPYHSGVAHAKIDGFESVESGESTCYSANSWDYIDEDGNRLFDSINADSAIKVDLK